jgi:hypothetical protein
MYLSRSQITARQKNKAKPYHPSTKTGTQGIQCLQIVAVVLLHGMKERKLYQIIY